MPRDQVFISYSHEDTKWREDLEKHLKPYLRTGSIKSWSDKQISPGSQWFTEIETALTNTKVAVLLVTPEFLASDFIGEHELGPLLKQAEQGGVKILWVPIRGSAYKQTALKNYQAALSPDTPLADMTRAKRDRAWVDICGEIEKAVNPRSKLERAVKQVENKVNIQEKELAWIKTLIQLFLSDSARANLKKFAEDGPFMSDIERGSGFEWELRHLLSLQLIDRVPGKGMRTLFALHGHQNVKDHLSITQRGRDYLRLFGEAYC